VADPNLGGRNFDEILKDHFVEEIKVLEFVHYFVYVCVCFGPEITMFLLLTHL